MPNIGMKIIKGNVPDPQGQQVSLVKVGDPVLFVWYLPSPSSMNFFILTVLLVLCKFSFISAVVGLRVRHCTAETRKGNRVQILDNG